MITLPLLLHNIRNKRIEKETPISSFLFHPIPSKQRTTMISASSYRNKRRVNPIQPNSSEAMSKFDRLLMRAAKNKRKDIINRYGHEGCDKLLAKGKQEDKNTKREDPKLLKKKYENTIRDLLDVWDISSRSFSTNTTEATEKTIENAWVWDLSNH